MKLLSLQGGCLLAFEKDLAIIYLAVIIFIAEILAIK